jgi:hypothetical protein
MHLMPFKQGESSQVDFLCNLWLHRKARAGLNQLRTLPVFWNKDFDYLIKDIYFSHRNNDVVDG